MASSSATVGMASAQARREATSAPAALAYSAQRAGSQPDSSPCTSAPPNASPAPRPQTTSTGCGGTTVVPSAVATSTPSPPIFTSASSTPRASSRAAASCGSLVPTATSTSARLPTVTVTWSSIASYSARASSGEGQNISRQSRSRMVQRPEPGSGRGRRASISSWVVRAGSTLTPVPVTHRTGTSDTTSHGTSAAVIVRSGAIGAR